MNWVEINWLVLAGVCSLLQNFLCFGQGFYNFAMRGRHIDAYSAYKRVASKDYFNAYDREEESSGASGLLFHQLFCILLLLCLDFGSGVIHCFSIFSA